MEDKVTKRSNVLETSVSQLCGPLLQLLGWTRFEESPFLQWNNRTAAPS